MTAPAARPALCEIYPFRAQLAYTFEYGTACTPLHDAQTLAAYVALESQIAALEGALPARWTPPAGPSAVDWCCPRVPGPARPGPARCGVCDADEDAARAALWAALGEAPRATP